MCSGHVLVYGGRDTNESTLASVEIMFDDQWQLLSTPMFEADYYFSSVPLQYMYNSASINTLLAVVYFSCTSISIYFFASHRC